jgi:XRE family transcriptional regulator, master regulator for biofilm formation
MKTLGEKFKELRKARGYSQEAIADKLGVSKSFISLIESNKREPGPEFITKAAALFDVDIAEFYTHKIKSPEDLDKEGLRWIIFGEELKQQGITLEQVREWVKAIQAFQNKK